MARLINLKLLADFFNKIDPNRTFGGLLALAGGENRRRARVWVPEFCRGRHRGKHIHAALMPVHAEGELDGAILNAGALR